MQAAEAAFTSSRLALHTALTEGTADVDDAVAAMAAAEDAVLDARRSWAASAGLADAPGTAPARAPRPAVGLGVRWAKPVAAGRSSVTLGAWV